MPRKIKMNRMVGDDGEAFEDYFDYVFPDDEKPMGKYNHIARCSSLECIMNV